MSNKDMFCPCCYGQITRDWTDKICILAENAINIPAAVYFLFDAATNGPVCGPQSWRMAFAVKSERKFDGSFIPNGNYHLENYSKLLFQRFRDTVTPRGCSEENE